MYRDTQLFRINFFLSCISFILSFLFLTHLVTSCGSKLDHLTEFYQFQLCLSHKSWIMYFTIYINLLQTKICLYRFAYQHNTFSVHLAQQILECARCQYILECGRLSLLPKFIYLEMFQLHKVEVAALLFERKIFFSK